MVYYCHDRHVVEKVTASLENALKYQKKQQNKGEMKKEPVFTKEYTHEMELG